MKIEPWALIGIGTWVLWVRRTKQTERKVTQRQARVLQYAGIIREAAGRYRISPALVAAVIDVESAGDAAALSDKGARGLMQVLCSTARDMELKGDCNLLFLPTVNIPIGTKYIRWRLEYHGGNLREALQGYSGGKREYADEVLKKMREYEGLL